MAQFNFNIQKRVGFQKKNQLMEGKHLNRQPSAQGHSKSKRIQRKPSDKSIKPQKYPSINSSLFDQASLLKIMNSHRERSPSSSSDINSSICYISPRRKEVFPSASTSAISKNQDSIMTSPINASEIQDRFVRSPKIPLTNIEVETELECVKIELKHSKKENQHLKEEVEKLNSLIKNLKEENEFLCSQFEGFKDKFDALSQQAHQLKKQNQILQAQALEKSNLLQEYQEQQQNLSAHIRQFQILHHLFHKMRYECDQQSEKVERLKQSNEKYLYQIQYWKKLAQSNSRGRSQPRLTNSIINKQNSFESSPQKNPRKVLEESIFELSPD